MNSSIYQLSDEGERATASRGGVSREGDGAIGSGHGVKRINRASYAMQQGIEAPDQRGVSAEQVPNAAGCAGSVQRGPASRNE